MALLFNAAGEKVDHGSDASLDDLTTFTILAWGYKDSLSGRWCVKGPSAGLLELNVTVAGEVALFRSRVGTNTNYVTNNAALGTGAWIYLAASFDVNGAAGEVVNIYTGSLTALATERTYGTANDGSSGVASDAAEPLKFGTNRLDNQNFDGRLAVVAVLNRVLSAAEVQSWQFRPRKMDGCVLFSHYGFAGTGTQPDLSGNANNGTVTGATLADHVPLGPPFGYAAVLPYIVAAAGQTVTPSALALLSAISTPTVVPGAVTLSPGALALLSAVATPSIVLGAVTLTPSAVALLAALAAPTVAVGAVSLTPGALALLSSIAAPVLVVGSVTLTPSPASLSALLPDPNVGAFAAQVIEALALSLGLNLPEPSVFKVAPASGWVRDPSAAGAWVRKI